MESQKTLSKGFSFIVNEIDLIKYLQITMFLFSIFKKYFHIEKGEIKINPDAKVLFFN